MPTSNCYTPGRCLLRHGVTLTLHVPRRGSRWGRKTYNFSQNRSDASSTRPRRRQRQLGSLQNSTAFLVQREQRQFTGKSESTNFPNPVSFYSLEKPSKKKIVSIILFFFLLVFFSQFFFIISLICFDR